MVRTALAFSIFCGTGLIACAQQTLTGRVVDPSGAVIVDASVTITLGTTLSPLHLLTDARGAFTATGLSLGNYRVAARAEGFESAEIMVSLRAGRGTTLTLKLGIAGIQQEVDVNGNDNEAGARGADGAITLNGKALDDLPSDPSSLLLQLQQLSGGDSPQLFVDGFSGGTLPPKNTIREIRINENTYSAKNDVSPSFGRIDVFTKPGTGSWHGSLFGLGNDSSFNTSNPYTPNQPPYYNWRASGDVSGPLSKRASFDMELFRTSMEGSSIANGVVLNNSLMPTAFFTAVPSPDVTTSISPRLDFAANENDTLLARYSAIHETHLKNGIVQFSLPSQAYDTDLTTQLLQISNSQTIGARILDDTRFQYTRIRTTQKPASTDQTVSVQGAFVDGGNTLQRSDDHQDLYELQNYLTTQVQHHFLNVGTRLRVHRDANFSSANFNGTFVYASINSYQRTLADVALGYTPAQVKADGGGPTQFSLTTGSAQATASIADVGIFAQDDWKISQNFTLLAGLRYETQNAISDHHDFAPRTGFDWGVGARSKGPRPHGPWFSAKAGAGIFYSRLDVVPVLQATRLNGITQQQYILSNPTFYATPSSIATISQQSTAVPTTFRISPDYHSPYLFNAAIALDRPLGKHALLSVNYTFIRGVHLQLERNTNAPLAGTYIATSPTSGVRPLGLVANVDQYESTGVSRSNRLGLSAQFTVGKAHMSASYDLRFNNTDANSGGFPSNGYNLRQDYGRSPDDTRHIINLGMNDNPFPGFFFFVHLHATSGAPFNITTGTDLNGDSQFTDRPSFATDLTRSSVVHTSYGNLDASPLPGQQIIPYDLGKGPAQLSMEAGLRYEFGVGPTLKSQPAPTSPQKSGGSKAPIARRFNAAFVLAVEDLPNFVNRGTPVGILSSPLFGQSTNLSADAASPNANRIIFLIMNLRF